jgi:hypothetical protein
MATDRRSLAFTVLGLWQVVMEGDDSADVSAFPKVGDGVSGG